MIGDFLWNQDLTIANEICTNVHGKWKQAEKELDLLQDSGKLKKQKDIDHHSPKHTSINCHLRDPLHFSWVTSFKSDAVFLSGRNQYGTKEDEPLKKSVQEILPELKN